MIFVVLLFSAAATCSFWYVYRIRKKNYTTLAAVSYVLFEKQHILTVQGKTISKKREGTYFKIVFLFGLGICATGKITGNRCVVRALGSLIIMITTYTQSVYWMYVISSCLPTLLFINVFSVFIYFFARVVIEEDEDSNNNLLKPFFMVFNILSYVVVIIIAIYRKGFL